MRALHGYRCHESGDFIPFENVCENINVSNELKAQPNEQMYAIYSQMLPLIHNLQKRLPSLNLA